MNVERLLQELIGLLKANPQLAVFLGLALFAAVGRMFGGAPAGEAGTDARGAARRPRAGQVPPAGSGAPTSSAELEERIRRNFEEMLRRRAGGGGEAQTATAPAPASRAPSPPARAPSESTRTEPTRAPRRRNYEEAIPREARRPAKTRLTPPRKLEPTRGGLVVRTAATSVNRHARPRGRASLPRLDRAGLRRAVMLREILSPPRALQELDGPPAL